MAEDQPASKKKLTITFRENGDPEGKTLQEFCNQAPVGTKITLSGKVLEKTSGGWIGVET